jgi:DNA polymerase III sliding clamp (beta) subunit (PCNA family)
MDRKALVDALNLTKLGLANNKVIPIFSYFYFKDNEIRSFNGYEGIITKFTHTLDCCIEGDLLIKLLNSYDNKDVEVIQDTNFVTIKIGKSETQLPVIQTKDFIFNNQLDTSGIKITLTDTFVEGLSTLLDIASKDKIQENKNGITLLIENNLITLFSTNGKTVAQYTTDVISENIFNVFLPFGLCEKTISFYNTFKSGELYITDTQIKGMFTDIALMSLKKDVELLQFKQVVFDKFDFTNIKLVNKDGLETIIKRAVLFYPDLQDKLVNFNCTDTNMIITAKFNSICFTEELDISLGAVNFNILLNELNNTLPKAETIGILQGDQSVFVYQNTNFLAVTGI